MDQLVRVCFLLGLILSLRLHANAQEETMAIPVGDLAESMKQNSKPIMILVTTSWCKYCHLQKAQLLKNKAFTNAKDVFYYSELNAESEDDILFNGQVYRFKNSGDARGIHELAVALADKKEGLSYPLWIVMDKNYKVLLRRYGLLSPKEMKEIIEALAKTRSEF